MAEEIASADLNNLYLSSCFFADPEKYRAFCAFYALMRVVDDRVDGLPPRSRLSQSDHQVEHDILQAWEDSVRACYEGRRPDQTTLDRCAHDGASALFDSLMSSLGRFPVPSDLWRDFFSAMHRDIDRPRFGTWKEFLEYARGASVAPTTIYLFLIASRRDSPQGTYRPPSGSDLKTCGYHLGIFAYLGHVVRDLTEDLGSGEEGLLYFSREDMDAFGLTELRLRADVEARRASAQTRDLIAALLGRARTHLSLGRDSLTRSSPAISIPWLIATGFHGRRKLKSSEQWRGGLGSFCTRARSDPKCGEKASRAVWILCLSHPRQPVQRGIGHLLFGERSGRGLSGLGHHPPGVLWVAPNPGIELSRVAPLKFSAPNRSSRQAGAAFR